MLKVSSKLFIEVTKKIASAHNSKTWSLNSMATIKIANLNPVGSDLFNDHESYLKDLTDEETSIKGGFTVTLTVTLWISSAAGSGLSLLASVITSWGRR